MSKRSTARIALLAAVFAVVIAVVLATAHVSATAHAADYFEEMTNGLKIKAVVSVEGYEDWEYTDPNHADIILPAGSSAGEKIAVHLCDSGDSDIEISCYYRKNTAGVWGDPITDDPTAAGIYKVVYFGTDDPDVVIAEIEYEIESSEPVPVPVAVEPSGTEFYYTGDPVPFEMCVTDALYAGDFIAAVTWNSGNTPVLPGTYGYTVALAPKEGGSKSEDDLPYYYPSATEGSITIRKAASKIDAISLQTSDLTYNGSSKALLTAGNAVGGTLLFGYCVGDVEFQADSAEWFTYGLFPRQTEAGTYHVYRKVLTNDCYEGIESAYVGSVTISQATDTALTTGIGMANVQYTGAPRVLITTAGAAKYGATVLYRVGNNGEGTADVTAITATHAGDYEVQYRIVGNANYVGTEWTSAGNAKITKADATISVAPAPKEGLVYNGKAQALADAASAVYSGGELRFSSDGTNYGADVPTGRNAAAYTVYYKVVGDADHNDVGGHFSVSIAPKPIAVTYTGQAMIREYGDESWSAFGETLADNGYYLTADLCEGDDITDVVSVKFTDKSGKEVVTDGKLPVGTYDYVAESKDNANYDVSITLGEEATLTVVPAAWWSVSASNKTVTYNGEAQSFFEVGSCNAAKDAEVTYTFATEEKGTYTGTIPSFRNAGTYTVYFKANATYHEEKKGSYKLTIVPKAIMVTAEDKSSACGEALVELTATDTGLAAGDSVGSIYTLHTDADNTKVGEYDIVPISKENPNYAVTFVNGKYTVYAKADEEAPNEESEPIAEPNEEGNKEEPTSSSDEEINKEENPDVGQNEEPDEEGGSVAGPKEENSEEAEPASEQEEKPNDESGSPTEQEENTNETSTPAVDIKEQIRQAANDENNAGVSIKDAIRSVIEAAETTAVTLTFEVTEETTLSFDKAALTELAKNADVRLTYAETKAEAVAERAAENKALRNAQLIIEVSLCGATFEGGTATVKTAFENEAPEGKKAVVYYVDEQGKKTDMNATFEGGYVTFETSHFSTYVVEYVWSKLAIAAIIAGSVVGTAVIVFCIVFFCVKKKKKAQVGR